MYWTSPCSAGGGFRWCSGDQVVSGVGPGPLPCALRPPLRLSPLLAASPAGSGAGPPPWVPFPFGGGAPWRSALRTPSGAWEALGHVPCDGPEATGGFRFLLFLLWSGGDGASGGGTRRFSGPGWRSRSLPRTCTGGTEEPPGSRKNVNPRVIYFGFRLAFSGLITFCLSSFKNCLKFLCCDCRAGGGVGRGPGGI